MFGFDPDELLIYTLNKRIEDKFFRKGIKVRQPSMFKRVEIELQVGCPSSY